MFLPKFSTTLPDWTVIIVHENLLNYVILFQVVTRVPKATEDEMLQAVASAKEAFETWSQLSILSRQQVMFRYQDIVRKNMVSGRWLNVSTVFISEFYKLLTRDVRRLKVKHTFFELHVVQLCHWIPIWLLVSSLFTASVHTKMLKGTYILQAAFDCKGHHDKLAVLLAAADCLFLLNC
jgi:hypothetical protein